MRDEKKVSVTLVFRVTDEGLLRALTEGIVKEVGDDEHAPLAHRAVELLLHSNPNVPGYLDVGLELMDTKLEEV